VEEAGEVKAGQRRGRQRAPKGGGIHGSLRGKPCVLKMIPKNRETALVQDGANVSETRPETIFVGEFALR